MRVILVRHAEVIEEYQGKYNGHIDITLSKKGKEDAKKLANKLKDIHFDKIYCSDLLRAKETLQAFKPQIEVIFTSKLREKSWGKHEGKSFEDIQKSGITYKSFEQWVHALDGQNIDTFLKEAQRYFYTEILQQKSQNILVVTHSGFIKVLLSHIQNISLEEAFRISLHYTDFMIFDTATNEFY